MPDDSIILVYSIHKSGTMFLHRLLGRISRAYGIRHASANYRRCLKQIEATSWQAFIEECRVATCFGPIRQGLFAPMFPRQLDRYRILLHVRDPRDVLTSDYFSRVYSHPGGRLGPSFKSRIEWRRKGIDASVLSRVELFRRRYSTLADMLCGRDNVTIVKYEKMVTDFPEWLDQVLNSFRHLAPAKRFRFRGVDDPHEAISQRLKEKFGHTFLRRGDRKWRHKRQVTPGDHLRKLNRDTIEQLNREFSSVLSTFGYDVCPGE